MLDNLIVFLYALILGSFFNVAGLRLPLNESIIKPRSACPACGTALSSLELIPVISYVFQSGRCRNCKTAISLLYPVIELTTASLFLFAYVKIGWSFDLLIAWALISLFMIIFVSDIVYMLIPDKLLLFFSVIFIILRILHPLSPWWDSLLGAAAGFSVLLVIALASKGGLGGGDIKLFGVIGLLLGTKTVILSFILATFAGAIWAFAGFMKGTIKSREPFPFGPFIAIGTLVAFFYEKEVLAWYFSLFY